MECRFADGRLLISRTPEEKRPLVTRLSRIEGQVRGVRAMIEDDRYCLDEVQQVNAATAALREVALELISQHLTAGLACAAADDRPEEALADILTVLRAAMRRT